MLKNMVEHIFKQFDMSFESFVNYNDEMANKALEMDYISNNMHEKIRSSVDTVISINPYSEFSKTMVFSEVAYDLERIPVLLQILFLMVVTKWILRCLKS
jgi:phosphate transport system protein